MKNCNKKILLAITLFGLGIVVGVPTPVLGQKTASPVYTDDSPDATQLFARAGDQVRLENLVDAVRIYQQLLDQYARRLMAVAREEADPPTTYRSVRENVLLQLRTHPVLLEAYRTTVGPEAQRRLEQGDRREVFLRCSLTEAGFDAGLQLTESAIRAARFAVAVNILEDLSSHPDRNGPRETHWLRLRALVATLRPNPDEIALTHATDRLAELGAVEEARRLRALGSSLERPGSRQGVDPLHPLENPSLDSMGPTPIWQTSWPTRLSQVMKSPLIRQMARSNVESEMERGLFLGVIPTIIEDQILVSDGLSLVSVDRYDGRRRWSVAPSGLRDAPNLLEIRTGGWNSLTRNPTTVVVDGVYAATILRRKGDTERVSYETELVCVDRRTGETLWSRRPSDLHPDFDRARFSGVPVVAEGRLWLVVRKMVQSLVSDYLVALNLDDGKMLWHQHLASTGGARGTVVLPSHAPLWRDGIVYVSTPVGCVAAVEAEFGLTQWLRLPAPVRGLPSETDAKPWEFQIPLWTRAGLIVFTPDRRGLLVLDPTTGDDRFYAEVSRWGHPRYMLADEDHLFALSDTGVTRIPLDHLNEPEVEFLEMGLSERIFGRASIGNGQILVPTDQRLRLVDTRTGETQSERLPHAPGTPVLMGGEMIMATSADVASYLPYEVGEPQLLARQKADPQDANPAISLASLAFRHGRYDRVLPAIDEAIGVINEAPFHSDNRQAQARLFATLLGLAPSPRLETKLADQLFVRLRQMAGPPRQRLDYLFAFGAYLEDRDRSGEAVDAYQAILLAGDLADQFWDAPGHRYRARQEAEYRVRRIMGLRGRAHYAVFETAAAEEFDQWSRRSDASAQLALAMRYPGSTVAWRACLEAGRTFRAAGNTAWAIRAWRQGLALDPEPDPKARLYWELLTLLENEHRIEEAMAEVHMARWADPFASTLDSAGNHQSLSDWEAQLTASAREQTGGLARFGPVTDYTADVTLGDDLLLPALGSPSAHVALIRHQRQLNAYGRTILKDNRPTLGRIWRTALDIEESRTGLLAIDHDYAWLWTPDRRSPQRVIKVDLTDGEVIWQTPTFAELVEQNADPAETPWPNGLGSLQAAGSRETLVLAERYGRILGLDRESGVRRWSRVPLLNRLRFVEMNDRIVAVGGTRRGGSGESGEIDVVILLDANTGRSINEFTIDTEEELQWVVVSENEELIYATNATITCYDLLREEIRWTAVQTVARGDQYAFVTGRHLLLSRFEMDLQRVDLNTGEKMVVSGARWASGRSSPPVVSRANGRFILKFNEGISIFDGAGHLVGRMARSGDVGITVRAVAAGVDRIVMVERHERASRGSGHEIHLYSIDLTGKKLEHAIRIDPKLNIPKPDGAQALHDWIFLDAGSQVIYIPAPVEPIDDPANADPNAG